MTGLPALAALAIAIVLGIWLIRVVKETMVAALGIVAILAVLFFVFGIDPTTIWAAAAELIARGQQWFQSVTGNAPQSSVSLQFRMA